MNFLEAINELEKLNEAPGPGGQRTYKQFLIHLATYLGCAIPANYDIDGWVLHHINFKHDENHFENLALMNKSHHISYHKQCDADSGLDKINFLKTGHTATGENFEVWFVGEQILECINLLMQEQPISEIVKQEE